MYLIVLLLSCDLLYSTNIQTKHMLSCQSQPLSKGSVMKLDTSHLWCFQFHHLNTLTNVLCLRVLKCHKTAYSNTTNKTYISVLLYSIKQHTHIQKPVVITSSRGPFVSYSWSLQQPLCCRGLYGFLHLFKPSTCHLVVQHPCVIGHGCRDNPGHSPSREAGNRPKCTNGQGSGVGGADGGRVLAHTIWTKEG